MTTNKVRESFDREFCAKWGALAWVFGADYRERLEAWLDTFNEPEENNKLPILVTAPEYHSLLENMGNIAGDIMVLKAEMVSYGRNVADHEQQIGYLKSQINYIISLFPEGTALGRGYEATPKD